MAWNFWKAYKIVKLDAQVEKYSKTENNGKTIESNPFEFSFYDKFTILITFFIGVILIFFGNEGEVYLKKYIVDQTTIKYVLLIARELGVTAVVASIVGFTIEKFLKKRQFEASEQFREQLGKNVLSAVFKRFIPDTLYEEIKDSVLESTILKKDSVMTYEISFPQDVDLNDVKADLRKELVKVKITSEHVISNQGYTKRKFKVRYGVSCDLDKILADRVKIDYGQIGEIPMSDKELSDFTKKLDGNSGVGFEKEIELGPQDEIKVLFRSHTFRRKNDSEIWTTTTPADGMKLKIIAPQSIEIYGRGLHTKPVKKEICIHNENAFTFNINAGVYPHQGFAFWWRENAGHSQ
ncbi:hypothetical protein MN202_00275 [Rheinheimera muenzenbergensis]|uniref:Uncharacterized protein n=1 Tax=Rheinheimera muenzenbergensis TaxID=1193628 RepID=A0ABU8C1X1_9GAMM